MRVSGRTRRVERDTGGNEQAEPPAPRGISSRRPDKMATLAKNAEGKLESEGTRRHLPTLIGFALIGVALIAFVPVGSEAQEPAKLADGLYAQIQTSKGRIVARLEPALTPLTVANFVGLAEGTIANSAFDPGRPYYDGSVYHRVVPGHVIHTGV